MKRHIRLSFALLSAIVAFGCTTLEEGSEALAPTCNGISPTEWYLAEIAPALPVWQQRPDQPAAQSRYLDQGKIELSAFGAASDETLACWAERGDKLAALAWAVREMESALPPWPAVLDSDVERYLRIAARDDAPSVAECEQAFCHGVPEAMYRLAIARRVDDVERRSLLERAGDAGFTRAIYELSGLPIPENH